MSDTSNATRDRAVQRRRRSRPRATARPNDGLLISPAAAAVLELTSGNPGDHPRPDDPQFITSKDSYLIAGVATAIARMCLERERALPTDADVKSCIYTYLHEIAALLRAHYRKLPILFVGNAHDSASIEQNILSVMMLSFVTRRLAPSPLGLDDQSIVDIVNESVRLGHDELMEHDCILDPILETGLGFAILSIAPFSVTKRTKKGEQIYLQLRSLMWSYERKKTRDGAVEVDLRFEAARIARALKIGITAAFHDATKGEGPEP